MKSVIRAVISLGIVAFTGAFIGTLTETGVWAQAPAPVSPPAPVPPPAETDPLVVTPLTGANSTRTAEAVISAVDTKANTLSLQVTPQEKNGAAQTMLAVPGAKCRFIKNNRAAVLSDFAVGDKVIVRLLLRTAPASLAVVREMADAASYAEQQKQGKEITEGKTESITAKEITVLRADGVSVTFRVSPKTLVTKADAPATLAAYPVGSAVAVKPRRLPTGNLMASVVAESKAQANWIYQDTLTTWSGSVTAVDGNETTGATIRIKRDDGATRSFLVPANVTFKGSRGDVSWAKMVGMNVTAHLLPRGNGLAETRTADAIKVTGTSPEDAVKAP